MVLIAIVAMALIIAACLYSTVMIESDLAASVVLGLAREPKEGS